jgi:hypothetical protein
MSYARKAKKTGRLPPFVPLTWEILNSRAYIELPPSAAKALPYFIGKNGKSQREEGADYCGEIEFTYGEAIRLGFANRTFSRVIQGLTTMGFLDPAAHGGLRGFCKSTNKFKLSLRWRDYGKPSFEKKEWKCSEPVSKSEVVRKYCHGKTESTSLMA